MAELLDPLTFTRSDEGFCNLYYLNQRGLVYNYKDLQISSITLALCLSRIQTNTYKTPIAFSYLTTTTTLSADSVKSGWLFCQTPSSRKRLPDSPNCADRTCQQINPQTHVLL